MQMLGCRRTSLLVLAAFLTLASAVGCGDHREERVGTAAAAIDAPLAAAYCSTEVTGFGTVPTETDYLPNVINCEHGGADLETLKAQAIAARSFLYWKLATWGEICDSTNCQVYSCGRTPSAIHQQAVDETSGVYLAYNGNLTCSAYLAGDAATSPPECEGGSSDGPITYNEGRSGTDVQQTTLLWVHDPGDADYGQNRGCMSQNGASCLAEHRGYDHEQIIGFYYGADIEMVQATGPCVLPLPTETGAGGEGAGGDLAGNGGATAGGGFGGRDLHGSGAAVVGSGDADSEERPSNSKLIGEISCTLRAVPSQRQWPSAAMLLLGMLSLPMVRRRAARRRAIG